MDDVSKALVMLAQAMGIDPLAISLAGRPCPMGIELRVIITPDLAEEIDMDQEVSAMMDQVEKIMGSL